MLRVHDKYRIIICLCIKNFVREQNIIEATCKRFVPLKLYLIISFGIPYCTFFQGDRYERDEKILNRRIPSSPRFAHDIFVNGELSGIYPCN